MTFYRKEEVRVYYYAHQVDETPAAVIEAFTSAGAEIDGVRCRDADILLFGICPCCRDSFGRLEEMLETSREHGRADGGMGVVLFTPYKSDLRISGVLNAPTPNDLVAAALEIYAADK